MITIIHGDDISTSRNFFLKQKEKKGKTTSFGSDLEPATLIQEIEGSSIFGSSNAIFIENLITETKDRKKLKETAEILKKAKTDVFLWEKKVLSKTELSLLPGVKNEIFKLPKTIFSLLDSITPGNGKQLIKLFHETLAAGNENQILFMLVKRLRLMLASLGDAEIEDYKFLAPWQRQRIKAQTKNFTKEKLIADYNALYNIDKDSKTGRLNMTLTQSIDFFLLEI